MAVDTSKTSNGLKVALDTIIAPKEAFSAIRTTPVWAWAFLLIVILFAIGYVMERPAANHAAVGTIQHMIATSPYFSGLSDEAKSKMVANAEHPGARDTVTGVLAGILGVAVAILFNALLLLAGSAAGKGSAGFSRLWAASVNIGVPTLGLSAVVLGVITTIEGPNNFNVTTDLIRALPNLGWLVPGLQGTTALFLASLNIFVLWGLWLNFQALRWTAEVRGPMAWITPVVITLLGAFVTARFASFAG